MHALVGCERRRRGLQGAQGQHLGRAPSASSAPDGHRGVAHERAQQRLVHAEPAAHGRAVEEPGVVLALDAQAAIGRHDVDEELEVLGVPRVADDAHAQGRVGQRLGRDRGVEVEQHRHQRQARRIALDLQLPEQAAEGDALVFVGIEHEAARGGQVRARAAFADDGDADRQDVDAVAHEAVRACDRLARGRHADHEVVAAREAREQQREGREQRREQARVVLRADALDGVPDRGIDVMILAQRREAAMRARARAIHRQVERRDRAVVDADPPALILALLGERFGRALRERVVAEAGRVLEEGRLAGGERAIDLHQLLGQHAERPAVAHDVVRGDHELAALHALAHQHGAHERAGGEVEAGLDGARTLRGQRGIARGGIERREVDDLRHERLRRA